MPPWKPRVKPFTTSRPRSASGVKPHHPTGINQKEGKKETSMTTSRPGFHSLLLVSFIGMAARLSLGQADPSGTGPHQVTITEYSLGDTAFTPPGFPAAVEIRAAVFYP